MSKVTGICLSVNALLRSYRNVRNAFERVDHRTPHSSTQMHIGMSLSQGFMILPSKIQPYSGRVNVHELWLVKIHRRAPPDYLAYSQYRAPLIRTSVLRHGCEPESDSVERFSPKLKRRFLFFVTDVLGKSCNKIACGAHYLEHGTLLMRFSSRITSQP